METASFIINIFSTIALIAAVAVALYYAIQAKRQADKTHELVVLGEREYAPNAVARIRNTAVNFGDITLKGIAIQRNHLADIPISMTNLSKGVSTFRLWIYPWYKSAGNYIYHFKESDIIGDLYKGERDNILIIGETIGGHFHINLSGLVANFKCLGVNRLIKTFGQGELHLAIFIGYGNEISKTSVRYADHYYFRFHGTVVKNATDGILVTGQWVFGGRTEKPDLPI
jgi:hypothetical protein